jgi:hypothetical protein
MAGDWIKMTIGLRTHPKVVRMASALKADKLRVIGGLFSVWAIFDEHTVDGLLEGYTPETIDDELHWRGFAKAMQTIGWLVATDDGLTMPDFDEHNGTSAKRRATDAKRKKEGRESDKGYGGSWTPSGQVSASDADKKQTRVREEKRREDTLLTESGAAKSPRPTKKAPPDFAPSPEMRAWARDHAPGVNVDAEAEKLRDHTFATARVDWDGTFRNWLRKAAETAPRNGAKPQQSTAERNAEAMRLLGIDPETQHHA